MCELLQVPRQLYGKAPLSDDEEALRGLPEACRQQSGRAGPEPRSQGPALHSGAKQPALVRVREGSKEMLRDEGPRGVAELQPPFPRNHSLLEILGPCSFHIVQADMWPKRDKHFQG